MQRVAIVISGQPGSGSTTLAKNMAKKLGWPAPFYSGGIVREIMASAEKVGRDKILTMPPEKIQKMMKSKKILSYRKPLSYKDFPAKLDLIIDRVQKELLEQEKFGVHEGRIAWFLADSIKNSGKAPDKIFIKICCVVDKTVGAERLQKRKKGSLPITVAEIVKETEQRLKEEEKDTASFTELKIILPKKILT